MARQLPAKAVRPRSPSVRSALKAIVRTIGFMGRARARTTALAGMPNIQGLARKWPLPLVHLVPRLELLRLVR